MVDYGGDDGNAALEELVQKNTKEKITENFLNERKTKPDTPFLYFTAFTAVVLVIACSSHLVWASPVIPRLTSNDTEINPIGRQITTIEMSLLAGLPYLLGLIGSLFVGKISDTVGRKKTMICMGMTVLVCNLIIALGDDVYVYIIARCIIFINFSGCLVVVPMYLLEICEDHNRAKFGCLMGLALPAGHLYVYVVGSLIPSVKVLTLLCGLPLIPYLVCFCLFAPESPVYLASKGKLKLAIEAIEKLRNNKSLQEIQKECDKIRASIKVTNTSNKVGLRTLVSGKISRKALLLSLIPVMAQHLSGVSVIMQFLAPIFNEADTYLSGNAVSIIAGIVKISVVLSTAMSIERFNRRSLLITSTLGSAIALFFMGLFFYWKHINWVHLDKVMWLPILCLIINLMMYSIGLGPISMLVVSVLFPGCTRAIGVSVTVTISGFAIFLLNFMFPIITDAFGVYCCIWFFSISCFIAVYIIYKFIPETRGKSIVEIQEIIEKL